MVYFLTYQNDPIKARLPLTTLLKYNIEQQRIETNSLLCLSLLPGP
jgi:hypothetical protein